MYDCEKAIADNLHYVMQMPQTGNLKFNITEAKIEEALLEFRLKNDFESWQRGHTRPQRIPKSDNVDYDQW